MEAEAQAQIERVHILEERARSLRTEVADAKAVTTRAERCARDLEATLMAEKEWATHQAEKSTIEVVCLEA